MTDFKLSSIAFDSSTFITPLPEFALNQVKPLGKGCHESYRLYNCLGCGKLVSICTHCDRGHWYCFDGCAISEPRRRACESQRRYASKKTTKVKRAAYMRDYYQCKKTQLALQVDAATEPSPDTIASFHTYVNPIHSFQPVWECPNILYRLLQLPKQAIFHPSHLPNTPPYFNDFSGFLTESSSLPLPTHAVIITSTYDIQQSVLMPNLGQNRAMSQTHHVYACCRTVLPQCARSDFLHTKIKASLLGGKKE